MVDAPRVSVLLHRIREEVAAHRRIAARPDDDLFDGDDALPAAKYRLAVAVEAMTDVDDGRVVEIMRTRLDDIDAYVDRIASRL